MRLARVLAVKKWSQCYFSGMLLKRAAAHLLETLVVIGSGGHMTVSVPASGIFQVLVCRQGRDPQKLLKDWKGEFVCFS